MPRTALVISGGGSKGAFAVGILKSIFRLSPDLRFDMVIGTSTGSLIAPFAAQGEIAILERLYTSVSTGDIITKFNIANRFLYNNSLFGTKPLAQLIAKYYTDTFYSSLRQGNPAIYLTTTCLQTGEAVYFCNKKPSGSSRDQQIQYLENGEMFRRAVLASTSQPVLMPPVEVQPGTKPIRQYVDGGVREYAAIQLAAQLGAEEIFAILLSTDVNEDDQIKYEHVFPILLRTIDIFLQGIGKNDVYIPELFNQSLQYLDNVKDKMRKAGIAKNKIHDFFEVMPNPFAGRKPDLLHILRPNMPLDGGLNGMNFDPKAMKNMVARGETYMDRFIAGLQPGDSILS